MINIETSQALDHGPNAGDEALIPVFNPTNAPAEEIYAAGKRLENGGWKPHSDVEPDLEAVDVWRLERKDKIRDGLGLVASSIALGGTLGDFANFEMHKHMASNQERRATPEGATPFVSFSMDPEYVAKNLVLKHGFGVKHGLDSAVVHARVHPSRLMSAHQKEEVLLVGGLAPDEYVATHEVGDFVAAHVDENEEVPVALAGRKKRDEALAHWKQSKSI